MEHRDLPEVLPLAGASGAVRDFDILRWTAAHPPAAGVYALLSCHGDRGCPAPTVLYVAEAEDLESALSRHNDYPCMNTFVDAVAFHPASSDTERADIEQDLRSLHDPPCDGCWPPTPDGPEGTEPYPDRVVGGCITHRELLDERLVEAVSKKRMVRFVYERRRYEVEPHAYGIQVDGHAALLTFRMTPGSSGEQIQGWQTFPVSEIFGLVITDRSFGGTRPAIDSPIAVNFARTEVLSRWAAASSEATASPETVAELRRELDEAVLRLRLQVLELRRIDARRIRLESELERRSAPLELSLPLHAIRAEQELVRESLLALIPEVALLQRHLPAALD